LAFCKKLIFTLLHDQFGKKSVRGNVLGANVLNLITDCEQSVVVLGIFRAIGKIKMMQMKMEQGDFLCLHRTLGKRKRPLAILDG